MSLFRVKCEDGGRFEIDEDLVNELSSMKELILSQTNMILPVKSSIFQLIIDFYDMRTRRNVCEIDDPEVVYHTVPEDQKFIQNIDKYTIRELVNASDYFQYEYLNRICFKQIARIFEQMTTEELEEYTGFKAIS
jgi:hypothetical protein